MTRALVVSLALAAAACGSPKPCAPETVSAMRELYEAASDKVIDSGACDKHAGDIERCAAYMAVEGHYMTARAACLR